MNTPKAQLAFNVVCTVLTGAISLGVMYAKVDSLEKRLAVQNQHILSIWSKIAFMESGPDNIADQLAINSVGNFADTKSMFESERHNKLSVVRQIRGGCYLERIEFRINEHQKRKLLELSVHAQQPVSHLMRSAVDLLLIASERVKPWDDGKIDMEVEKTDGFT